MGRRQASCSPATACADAKRCSSDGSTPGIVFAGHSVVGTTTHRRKEVCGGQATVVGHSVCGRRTARYRTARRRVTLYGAPLARRPTAARRCAAGRRRSSVTVSADAKQRRRSNQRMSHPYSWMGAWTWCCGAKWRHRGGTTDRGEGMNAPVSAVKALNHGASRWTTSHKIHRQDVKPARMQAVARSGGTEVTPPAVAK